MKEAAQECFPKQRLPAKQQQVINHNLIGYNELIRPLKHDVHNTYHAWKDGRQSNNKDTLWRSFQNSRNKYTRKLKEVTDAQDQIKYGLSTINDCHAYLKQKSNKMKPPKIINNASNPHTQIEMWTKHLKQTLNCYTEENSTNFNLEEFNDLDKPEKFHLHDVIKITQDLDPTKAYKNHILWRYAPTSALINLIHALNAFWVYGRSLGSDI